MQRAATESTGILIIEPSSPWRSIDLGEVWRYRELLFFFVWRDVKVRYKQTTLGIVWAVLQPLFAMLIFAFVFGRIAKLPSDGIPYALFAYTGLLPWTFFSNAVVNGSQSLISSASLVTKVYFPRILIPVASVLTVVVDFALAGLMLVPLLVVYRTTPALPALWWIPLLVAISLLLAFGFGIWLSALVARYRDFRHVIPFVVQIWMFVTPIIYPLSMVPQRWRWLVALNPMTGVVEAFRGSLFGRPFDAQPLIWTILFGAALVVSGGIYFRRVERMVADVL